jgi:hypothetical protein
MSTLSFSAAQSVWQLMRARVCAIVSPKSANNAGFEFGNGSPFVVAPMAELGLQRALAGIYVLHGVDVAALDSIVQATAEGYEGPDVGGLDVVGLGAGGDAWLLLGRWMDCFSDEVQAGAAIVFARLRDAASTVNTGVLRAGSETTVVVPSPYRIEVEPWMVVHGAVAEGLSQALLEAMASGKPVIASAAGGNVEVVRHETDGLLVPPLDPAAWAAAIERLLGDEALADRLGRAARERARLTFSLDHTVASTLALYRSLLGGRPAPPAVAHSPAEPA